MNDSFFLRGITIKHRVLLCISVFFLIMFLPTWLLADECQDKPTEAAEKDCLRQEIKDAEVKLLSIREQLMTKISPKGRQRLSSLDSVWRSYRQKQCEFETMGTEDGSVHPLVFSLCYLGITLEYQRRLTEQLNCQEGDLSCGGQ